MAIPLVALQAQPLDIAGNWTAGAKLADLRQQRALEQENRAITSSALDAYGQGDATTKQHALMSLLGANPEAAGNLLKLQQSQQEIADRATAEGLVGPASSGDKSALAKLMLYSPQTGNNLGQLQLGEQRLSQDQSQFSQTHALQQQEMAIKLQEQHAREMDFLVSKVVPTISIVPEAARPKVWGTMVKMARASGIEVPPELSQYGPETQQFLDAVQASQPIKLPDGVKLREGEVPVRDATAPGGFRTQPIQGTGGANPDVAVPGYEQDPQVKPSTKSVGDFRKTVGAANAYKNELAKLARLVDEHGMAVQGQAAREMKLTLKNAQLQFKNMQDLGAITGPDVPFIEASIPDPTTILGYLNPAYGKDQIKELIQQAASGADDYAGQLGGALGYTRKQDPSKPAAGSGALSPAEQAELSALRQKYGKSPSSSSTMQGD